MVATYKQTPVSAAEQEAIDAEQAVTDLEQKVIEGDTSITASAIDKARQAARFARLKVQAVVRQAEKGAEAARAAEVERVRAAYEEFTKDSNLDPLREAYDNAVLAIAELDELVKERIDAERDVKWHGDRISVTPPPDRASWAVPENVVELAYLEGIHGFPLQNAGVHIHVLHTPERKADMEAIRASGDLHGAGAELLARFRAE